MRNLLIAATLALIFTAPGVLQASSPTPFMNFFNSAVGRYVFGYTHEGRALRKIVFKHEMNVTNEEFLRSFITSMESQHPQLTRALERRISQFEREFAAAGGTLEKQVVDELALRYLRLTHYYQVNRGGRIQTRIRFMSAEDVRHYERARDEFLHGSETP